MFLAAVLLYFCLVCYFILSLSLSHLSPLSDSVFVVVAAARTGRNLEDVSGDALFFSLFDFCVCFSSLSSDFALYVKYKYVFVFYT